MDIVSDSLVKIKNAQKVGHRKVVIKGNRLLQKICDLLKEGGYIVDYQVMNIEFKFFITIRLRYDAKLNPAISDIVRISKNSRKNYVKVNEIPRIANGYATVIMSTSKGVLTGKQAKETNMGGEVICYVI